MAILRTTTPRRRPGVLLVIGLLAVTSGYLMLLTRTTVVDRGVTIDAARQALDDDEVRALLVRRTTDAVIDQLVGDSVARDLAAFGLDVRRDLRPVADSLVATPQFRTAFLDAIAAMHERVLVDPQRPVRLDVTSLVAMARERAIRVNPAYAEVIPAQANLVVTMPDDALPDLTFLDRLLSTTVALALLTIGTIAWAVAVHRADNRAHGVRRLAAWALGVGGLQLGACVIASNLAGRRTGDGGVIVRAIAASLLPRLVVPALGLIVMGAGLRFVALRVEQLVDRRLAADGRNAFWTDDDGRPVEWRLDGRYEPEVLRTAPAAPTFRR